MHLVGERLRLDVERLLPVTQRPALGHHGRGAVGVALAPEPTHVLRQHLHPSRRSSRSVPTALARRRRPPARPTTAATFSPAGTARRAAHVGVSTKAAQVDHGREPSGGPPRDSPDLEAHDGVRSVAERWLRSRSRTCGCAYGDVTAVDGVSFTAQAGQITAVLGPNGAGKTTTIEVLEGYRRPDGGRTSVIGLDPQADHAALTHRVGVMLQDGGVGPGVRAGEILRHAAALYADPLGPRRPPRAGRPHGQEAAHLAAALGGRATPTGAGPGPRRAPAGGLPRRARIRGRSGGPAGHPRGRGQPARRRRDRGADHPRPRRGRAPGRPRRDPGPRSGRRRRHARPAPGARGRRGAVRQLPGPST